MNHKQVYIIAEAGVNHNGSLDMAIQLIDVAADAGADAVKFQTFQTDSLVTTYAPKAEYQLKNTSNFTESQYQMLKKLELPQHAYVELIQHSIRRGIGFLSTPFDIPSLNFLISAADMPFIKISSGDITNAPLLWEVAKTNKPVILSTGMSTLGEIELALSVLAYGYTIEESSLPSINECRKAYVSKQGQKALKGRIVLLHCTSEYPAPYQDINLNALKTLKTTFQLPVGYSDHTDGIAVSIAAVACGATYIEKHFTLDKTLPGPDHKASLEPSELSLLVQSIRQVEDAIGDYVKIPTTAELQNSIVARKSIVASRPICAGEIFSTQNLTIMRPGNGVSPMNFWAIIGQRARRSYLKNELIDNE